MPEQTPLAEVAYKAYGSATGFKNFRGDPMPAWDDLGETIKHAWTVAADAILTASAQPTTTTRAKFRCNSAEEFSSGQRNYNFSAVTDNATPENERYHQYTPSGSLKIAVDNPAVTFELGHSYYLDFTLADEG